MLARKLLVSDRDLVAPSLIALEIAHVLIKRLRLKELSASDALLLLSSFDGLIETRDVANPWTSPFALANDYQISAYDACYVALAQQLECRLVTADRRLYNALSTSDVAVWIEDVDSLTTED